MKRVPFSRLLVLLACALALFVGAFGAPLSARAATTQLTSVDFLTWLGDSWGLERLTKTNTANLPYTNIGNADDATSLANMRAAIYQMREINAYRSEVGLPEFKVFSPVVANAQSDANYSSNVFGHSPHAGTENAAWNYSTTYDTTHQWVDEEKAIFDKVVQKLGYDPVAPKDTYAFFEAHEEELDQNGAGFSVTGHYLNLVNPDLKAFGYGINTTRGVTHVVDFVSSGTADLTFTVDEYEKKLNEFLTEKGAMFRLYNPYTGEHFYTADTNELSTLTVQGWRDEGIGWYAPSSSKTPVYRLYNRHVKGGDHHYTMDVNEYKRLQELGWTGEGIKWYSDDAKGTKLYREYNPYATTGTHNYTTDANEHQELIKVGWRDEGTAWYGLAE